MENNAVTISEDERMENSECLCNVPEGCFLCKGDDFVGAQVAEAQKQEEVALARVPRGPWMLRVEAAAGLGARAAAVAEVAALPPEALRAAFAACATVEDVVLGPRGVFFVTLADRASWQAALALRPLRVGACELAVRSAPMDSYVVLSPLPRWVDTIDLRNFVISYYRSREIIATSLTLGNCFGLFARVYFASCDCRQAARSLGPLWVNDAKLEVLCCSWALTRSRFKFKISSSITGMTYEDVEGTFSKYGPVLRVTELKHGRWTVTMETKEGWEMVLKQPSISFGENILKVVPSHASSAVLISHLPESIPFDVLEYEIRRYFIENGVLACATAHWAPCIMAVKFADCDNREMALRMRAVRLEQFVLPIVCCEADYARILLDAAGLSGPVATGREDQEVAGVEEEEEEEEGPLLALAEAMAAAAAEAGEPLAASPQRDESPTSAPPFPPGPLAPPPLPPFPLDLLSSPPPSPTALGTTEEVAQALIVVDEGAPRPQSFAEGEALHHSEGDAREEQVLEKHLQTLLHPHLQEQGHEESQEKQQQVLQNQPEVNELRNQQLPQEQQELQVSEEQQFLQMQQEPQEPREQQLPTEQRELQDLREQQLPTEQRQLQELREQQLPTEQRELREPWEQQLPTEQRELQEQQLSSEQRELQEPWEQRLSPEQRELQEPREQRLSPEQHELQELKEQKMSRQLNKLMEQQELQIAGESNEQTTLETLHGPPPQEDLQESRKLLRSQICQSPPQEEPMDLSPRCGRDVSEVSHASPPEETEERDKAASSKDGEGLVSRSKCGDRLKNILYVSESCIASGKLCGPTSRNQSKQNSSAITKDEENGFQTHRYTGVVTQVPKCFSNTGSENDPESRVIKKSAYSRTRSISATADNAPTTYNQTQTTARGSYGKTSNTLRENNKPALWKDCGNVKEDNFECNPTRTTVSKFRDQVCKPEQSRNNENSTQLSTQNGESVPQQCSTARNRGGVDSQQRFPRVSIQNVASIREEFHENFQNTGSQQVLPQNIVNRIVSAETSSETNSFHRQGVYRHNVYRNFSRKPSRSRNQSQEVPQQIRQQPLCEEPRFVGSENHLQEVPRQNQRHGLPKKFPSVTSWRSSFQKVPEQNLLHGVSEHPSLITNHSQWQEIRDDKVNQNLYEGTSPHNEFQELDNQNTYGAIEGIFSQQNRIHRYKLHRSSSEQNLSRTYQPQQQHRSQYNVDLPAQTPSQKNIFQHQEIQDYSVNRGLIEQPSQIDQSQRAPQRKMFTNRFDPENDDTQDRQRSFKQYEHLSDQNASYQHQETTHSRSFKDQIDSTHSNSFIKYRQLSRQSALISNSPNIPQHGSVEENCRDLMFRGVAFSESIVLARPEYTPGIPVQPEFSQELSMQNVYLHPMPHLNVHNEFSQMSVFGRGIFGRGDQNHLSPSQIVIPEIWSPHSSAMPQSFNSPRADEMEDVARLLNSDSNLTNSLEMACRIVGTEVYNFNQRKNNM